MEGLLDEPGKTSANRMDWASFAPRSGELSRWKPVPAEADPLLELKGEIANWMAFLSMLGKLFEENVYQNPDPHPMDYLMHRGNLHLAMGNGINLLMALWKEAADRQKQDCGDIEVLLQAVQAKIDELSVVFFNWHTPMGLDPRVPEGFKVGWGEAMDGQTEPMPAGWPEGVQEK